LLDQGAGLLECARRLGWALNTVKRYARAQTADNSDDRRATAGRWSIPTAITCATGWLPDPTWR